MRRTHTDELEHRVHFARLIDSPHLHRAMRCAFALVAGVAAAALLADCGNRADSSAPLTASTIAITAPDGSIPVASTMQFVATVTDADGDTITATPTWTVVNGGGTITSGGLFTAGDSIGTFVNTVVATIGSVTAASTVTVGAGALFSITVAPETVTVVVGATAHFVAVGRDAHGNIVAIPNLVWSSSGGTIDTSGTFTAGLTAGPGTVHVMSGPTCVSSSVVIVHGPISTISVHPSTVTLPRGWTQQFTTFGHDQYGNVFAIPNRVWSVAADGGTIDTAGLFTAGTTSGTFSATITSTVGSISGTGTVTVSPGVLASITVYPGGLSLPKGATEQYIAIGADSSNNIIAITPTWSVIGPGGGTINASTGLYTAGTTPGVYLNSVAATVSPIVGLASVQIVAPLASIVITPANPSMLGPGTKQFTATGYDASMNIVLIPGTLTWSLNTIDPLGTIDANGLFTYNANYDGGYADLIHVTNGTISASTSMTLDCGC